MGFDSKLNLSNCKFEQTITDSLNLSGCTDIYGSLNIKPNGSIGSQNGYQISGVTMFDTTRNSLSNVRIGQNILNNNTSGLENVGIGQYALSANTSGCYNLAIGSCSLKSNSSGCNNIAIGRCILIDNTIGFNNIGIGQFSIVKNTIGDNNIGIGANALRYNIVGAKNIAIGYIALGVNTSGNTNLAIGVCSLGKNTIGSSNIGIGLKTGCLNLTGSTNIFIGNCAGCGELGSGKLYIGTGNTSLIMGDMTQDCVILPKLKLRTAPTGSGGYLCYNPSTCLVEQTVGATGGTGSISVGNGLSLIGNTAVLGGSLTGNTVIDLNNNNFEILNINVGFNSGDGFDNSINSIQQQLDGKILVGGYFSSYSGVTVNRIIRLNSNGSIDNTFNLGDGFDGTVNSIQLQSDGKILVGGSFTTYSGATVDYIIRLNQDGTIDNDFNLGDGFDYYVNSIQLQIDEKILVGGDFTTYSGVTADHIIRLNSNGSIDNTFNLGDGFDGTVNSIQLQSDGKILVGGSFTTYSGATSNYIIRLNSNGSIDNTFNSGVGFNSNVWSIQLQIDGKILVGGDFTTYSGATSNYIIRLNSNGSIDNTFNLGLGFDSTVNSIQLQSDGKILVGGYFTTYSGVIADHIIRLNQDGTIDNDFNLGDGFDSNVYSIQLQSDGKILVGGDFTTYNGATSNYIIRLNSNGSIDNINNHTFRFNGKVAEYGADYSQYYTIRSIPDVGYVNSRTSGGTSGFTGYTFTESGATKLNLVGNNLTIYSPSGGTSGFTGYTFTESGATKLNLVGNNLTIYSPESISASNGLSLIGNNVKLGGALTGNTVIDLNDNNFEISNINIGFNSGSVFNESIVTLIIQPDGKILVSSWYPEFIRLNIDGSIDSNFNNNSGLDNAILSLIYQSDDKILAGGFFTTYSGITANHIIRLNSNGSIDNTFNSGLGFNSNVNLIIQQTDGKILVGGDFTTYSGVTANSIIRLNSNGSIDNTFNIGTGFNSVVQTITLQSDGKILVGGWFTTYSGVTVNRIIRLNSDGTIDNTFNSGLGFNSNVRTIELQSDGKILVGGEFSTYSGVTANRIIRLNSNGNIDNIFNSGSGFNDLVLSIQQQTDGKILIGGNFTSYSGVTKNYIIRLKLDGTIDNTFNTGSGFNSNILSIQQQLDGKILVGGNFSSYSGVTVNRIIRLNSDGSIDNVNSSNIFRFNGRIAEYGADYSQYYTARSIPDVAFVTGRTLNSPIIYKGSVTLTASQIFNNTWVEIIPSPGIGKMILSDKCYLFYKFGTTEYSANELTIELSYNSGITTHTAYIPDNATDLLNATGNLVAMLYSHGVQLIPSSNALYIRNNSYMTAPSGDGTLTLTIWYSIIDIE